MKLRKGFKPVLDRKCKACGFLTLISDGKQDICVSSDLRNRCNYMKIEQEPYQTVSLTIKDHG